MKLLGKDELKGIDSTQKTIEKWDEFFKKGLVNLGYKDSLLERMYPYKRGIPMLDGERMPVDPVTGRVFFELSLADKLCGLLACFPQNYSGQDDHCVKAMMSCMAKVWSEPENVKLFFPELTDEAATEKAADVSRALISSSATHRSKTVKELWKAFILNSEVYASRQAGGTTTGAFNERYLSLTELEALAGHSASYRESTVFFIWYKPFMNIYDNKIAENIKTKLMQGAGRGEYETTTAYRKIDSFGEVYMQDYLVISLNPIDKFMCSTKQAFGSCMSIAKQNDTCGTASGPAFGLPSLFGTDGVFLTFMTPGKHKNMYWEREEWEKPAEERDKEKAYKYLKMTCRALTYQGILTNPSRQMIKALSDHIAEYDKDGLSTSEKLAYKRIEASLAKMEPEKERLLVGRQYSARGEDFMWQTMIELFMARAGIRTGMAYAETVCSIHDTLNTSAAMNLKLFCDNYSGLDSACRTFDSYAFTRRAKMIAPVPIEIDRYGYLRPIYYDNLSLGLSPRVMAHANIDRRDRLMKIERYGGSLDHVPNSETIPVIAVGSSRNGSGGVCSYPSKHGLDMFKVLIGEQDISYYNRVLKICSVCKKILSEEEAAFLVRRDSEDMTICKSCADEKGLVRCPACNEYHIKDDADKHILYNIRELTNPKDYQDIPPKYVCLKQLNKALASKFDTGSSTYFICAHCGNLTNNSGYYMPSGLRSSFTDVVFHGVKIKVGLEQSCLDKAVMCDKCKRLIFLDEHETPCLLLNHKRVICPDCIDSIRMKQEKRSFFKNLLADLRAEDLKEERKELEDTPDNVLVRIVKNMLENNRFTPRVIAKTKDVYKQITSYLKAHPEECFPALKAPTVAKSEEEVSPVNEEVDPIESRDPVIPMF